MGTYIHGTTLERVDVKFGLDTPRVSTYKQKNDSPVALNLRNGLQETPRKASLENMDCNLVLDELESNGVTEIRECLGLRARYLSIYGIIGPV